MFELDQAVSEWRQQMLAAGLEAPELLDELESHLRDDVDRKVQSGLKPPEAFSAAVRQIGQPEALHAEFARAGHTLSATLKHLLLVFAGIPNPQLITNMNTTYPQTGLEPRWASYLKTSAFTLPAVGAWFFCLVFLVPKLDEMCHDAGTSLFALDGVPGVFKAFGAVVQFMVCLSRNTFWVSGALLLVLGLLEWRSRGWPRYRRAALGTGAFVVNLLVLVSITMLVLTACIVAPNLHHAR